jgi:SRSO17 transposase
VPLAKARRRIELDDRELQEELGLDPYERRHGVGWHHHVGLVTVAYAFLRSEQARIKKKRLARRCSQAVLMRLIGWYPRCRSRFEDSSQKLNRVLPI